MAEEKYMLAAIAEAKMAYSDGEVPVGAVIVRNGEIISRGRNRRETGKNALYHAEIEAINEACRLLGGWRLPGCEMYVTLEPCAMCAGAAVNARLEKIIFGASDKKSGCAGSVINVFTLPQFYHPAFEGGFMAEECAAILSDFFRRLR